MKTCVRNWCAAWAAIATVALAGVAQAQTPTDIDIRIGGDRPWLIPDEPWRIPGQLSSRSEIDLAFEGEAPAELIAASRSGRIGSIIISGPTYFDEQIIAAEEIIFQDGGYILLNPDHPWVAVIADRFVVPILLQSSGIRYRDHPRLPDGTDGRHGAAGDDPIGGSGPSPGRAGGPGSDGVAAGILPPVYIQVAAIVVSGRSEVPEPLPIATWELDGYVFDIAWRYPSHPFSLNFSGINGSNGGRGGDGGRGGRGRHGRNALDGWGWCDAGPGDGGTGARGGAGGRGGRGGDGGQGSQLILRVTEQSLAHFRRMWIGNSGGQGGRGGFGGGGGSGGNGGARGNGSTFCDGHGQPGSQGERGAFGTEGARSTDGATFPIRYEIIGTPD